ncbi:MAG: phage tail tube protein [Candidatus Paceibacterota bacterium]
MARMVGDQTQSAMIFESGTYAAASGTGQWLGMVQNMNIKEETGVMHVRYTQGASRNVAQHVPTLTRASAAFSCYPQDWRMLAFALGSCVDTSGTASTHVMSETNNNSSNAFTSGTTAPFNSFTLEDAKRFSDTGLNHVKTAYGNMIDEFTMSLPRGDAVKLDIATKAQYVGYGSGAATTVTASTTLPYLSQHAQFSLPSGTVMNEINSATIKISNGIVAEPWINGSPYVTLPYPTNREYSVELKVDANTTWAKTLYDQYYKGGSDFNMFFRIAPTATRYLNMTFSGCNIPTMDDPSTFSGGQEQTITIKPKVCSAVASDTVVKYNPW